jgi:uncharacterized membrane protein YdcZ (DUF606 family)
MDFAVAAALKEDFAPYEKPVSRRARAVTTALAILLSSLAALLSWNCNTRLGYSLGLRVLSSLIAFLFGGLYLLYYVLVRADICRFGSR